jgi:hypothetical protein
MPFSKVNVGGYEILKFSEISLKDHVEKDRSSWEEKDSLVPFDPLYSSSKVELCQSPILVKIDRCCPFSSDSISSKKWRRFVPEVLE